MVTELTPSILNLYINNAWCVIDGEEWIISHRIAEQFARKQIDIKPILRVLSSITQEEAAEFQECVFSISKNGVPQNDLQHLSAQSMGWLYLTSKGIDIFGLVPAGLAIEKKRIISYPAEYLVKYSDGNGKNLKKLFVSLDDAFNFYKSTTGEKALWDVQRMELIEGYDTNE